MAKQKKEKKTDQKDLLSRSFNEKEDILPAKTTEPKEVAEVEYKNMLGGTLKIDDVVFPGLGSLPLTDAQASTKRMKHAIECGVVVKD